MKLLSADCSFIGASVSPFDMSWLRTHLRKPLRRILLVGIVIIGATSLVTVLVTTLLRPPTLAHAQAALERKDYARAFELSEQILMNDRNSNEAKLIAGRAALGAGDNTLALQILRSIRDDGSDSSIEALLHCSQLAEKLGHLSEAEKFYRMLLRHRPEDLVANQGLVNLLRIEGRNWEARPAIYQLLRQRKFVFEYLAMAGPLEAVWLSADRDVPYLEYCGRVNPADQLYLLGPIRSVMMEENDLDKALKGLRKILSWNPNQLEAQAALGQLLFDTGAKDEFLAWHSRLPESANQHPTIWFNRARWARDQENPEAAIRCLGEAIKINPNDRAANLLMANLLIQIGDREHAAAFQRRGEDLAIFDELLMWGDLKEIQVTERWPKMIEVLERLGRPWEAMGWSELLLSADPGSPLAKAAIARLEKQLRPTIPLTLASANPTNTFEYSKFPLPNLLSVSKSPEAEGSKSAISFANVAKEKGLEFNYFVDKRRLAKRVYTFDFAGGGVGVLDFDQDGWPDLYLTQSSVWPPTESTETKRIYRDQLFRNWNGQRFEDVSVAAGVGDADFSNGVAVGDVNGDGFPDLYVNNLGPNRLYLNNGDGTFTDATDSTGTAGDDYSLSAVFVDLNRDGFPELYVVNYLGGDAMTRQCEHEGRLIQCSPLKFPGQQDRLYLNLGDGGFRDITHESGILDSEGIGKGMDVVAANLDDVGGPDLFVANDTTENFLYVNKTERGSQQVKLEDQATVAGVAFDEHGRTQSHMGIAAADVSEDGRIDFFVTNFYRERNNLYVQFGDQGSLLFGDQIQVSQLAEPGFLTMGWGTQFLDAELDGDWDLAVTNGYLDKNTAGAATDAMPPQFFENLGQVRFRELKSPQLGPYFASVYFGRSMARFDWNRDGQEDLCITHMGEPTALLQNTSQRRGRFAAIQLRGVSSCRDAIGSSVQIQAGGKLRKLQLIAGGGFQSASQQQILVGLGECASIDQITVHWPDDSEQVFRDLPVDHELLFIQGRPQAIVTGHQKTE